MNDPVNMTSCPSEETLAAFIDGRLEGEARRTVVEHLGACGGCKDIVLAAREMAEHSIVDPPAVDTVRFGRRVLFTPVALAVAAVVVVLFGALLYQRFRPDDMGAVIKATESLEFRPIEARLASQFPHRPFKGVPRGPGEDGQLEIGKFSLLAVTGDLQKKAEADPDSGTLHALGVSQLLIGNLDDSIETLSRALEATPPGSQPSRNEIIADLSAAHYARGQWKGSANDMVAALNEAEQVLAVDPKNAVALFNAGFALQWLDRRADAASLFRRYLEVDSSSPWAAEVQEKLRELQSEGRPSFWTPATVRQRAAVQSAAGLDRYLRIHQQRVRYWLEEELLPAWAASELDGRSTAEPLTLLRTVSASLTRVSGETLYARVAETLSTLSGQRRALAAQGYRSYKTARSAALLGDRAAAAKEAVRELTDAGLPSELASVCLAITEFMRSDFSNAIAIAERAARRTQDLSVAARAQWIIGMSFASRGEQRSAASAYSSALADFERLGDTEGAASAHMLLSELLDNLGDADGAWQHLRRALSVASRTGATVRSQLILDLAAKNCFNAGRPHAALRFQAGATRIAEALQDAEVTTHSLLSSALILSSLQRTPEALATIARAEWSMGRITDDAARRRAVADVLTAKGVCLITARPSEALSLLQHALAMQSATGMRFRAVQLRLATARAQLAAGHPEHAETELEYGIAEWMRVSQSLENDDLRETYFGGTEELFETLVSLLANRDESERAFRNVQLRRAALQRDRTAPSPVSTRELQSALDAGQLVVVYEVLDKELLTWLVSPTETQFERRQVTRGHLQTMVRAATRAIRKRNSSAAVADLARLILPRLRESPSIVTFVPDESLFNVPFAALVVTGSRRLLVDVEDVVIAPSIAAIVTAPREVRSKSTPHVLVVTVAGGEDAGTSPYLRAASRDVAALRAFPTTFLTGPQATPASFRQLAPHYEIIHYSGHGSYRADRPAGSALQLHGDEGAPSQITADELARMSFVRTRLVVLGACNTALTGERARVVPNIASAFASAGVPAVIGTLWDVEDEAASRFFEAFYAELEQGSTAAAAVRRAQQELRRRGDVDWAAFQLFGRNLSWG